MAGELKARIGSGTIGRLAAALTTAEPTFARHDFERRANRGLDQLELKARIDRVAQALATALPADFPAAADIVERALADPALDIWELWPVTVWIGNCGAGDIDRAAHLLALVTPRSSGEFGVRPLIDTDPGRMRGILDEWARADDEHVRRLASEGPRPLLPWAPRIALTAGDPGWAVPILDQLIDDPSPYVRRSVANHLNDLAKLDPPLALATAQRWQRHGGEHVDEILVRGLRALVKLGDPQALALVGCDPGAEVSVERLAVTPSAVRAGDAIELEIALRSRADRPIAASCGYAIVFARSTGRPSRKLFTLGTVSLAPGESFEVRRRYVFRPMSTRSYHPGAHAVEVMINGVAGARAEFELKP